MIWLDYAKERAQTQAEAIDAACGAFLRRTARPATHIEAPGTWTPPGACGLIWRGNSKWTGPGFRVGAEGPAEQGALGL
jgi:hypothetical protein